MGNNLDETRKLPPALVRAAVLYAIEHGADHPETILNRLECATMAERQAVGETLTALVTQGILLYTRGRYSVARGERVFYLARVKVYASPTDARMVDQIVRVSDYGRILAGRTEQEHADHWAKVVATSLTEAKAKFERGEVAKWLG